MGQSKGSEAYERKQGRTDARTPKKAEKAPNRFISFWPTESERKVLAADVRSLSELVEALQEHAERGLEFKIAQARDRSSLFVTCREQGADFNEGFTISVFHSSLTRAILAMDYCLTVKWPDFPEVPPQITQHAIDW